MSKCRDTFRKVTKKRAGDAIEDYKIWQAAWNARGRVDAEICRKLDIAFDDDIGIAIEKEDEHG